MKPAATPRHHHDSHDRIAAILSIIPGLGQWYKGYRVQAWGEFIATVLLLGWCGALLWFGHAAAWFLQSIGVPIGWVILLLSPFLIYFGVLPLLFFWATVAFEAYWERDLRHPTEPKKV